VSCGPDDAENHDLASRRRRLAGDLSPGHGRHGLRRLLEANVRGGLLAGVLREHVTAHSGNSCSAPSLSVLSQSTPRVELLAPDLAVLAGTEEVGSVVTVLHDTGRAVPVLVVQLDIATGKGRLMTILIQVEVPGPRGRRDRE
jgi:hypothetical protein